MEPVDGGSYLKEAALALAVQHAQHRPELDSYRVLVIADVFLGWLRKDSD